MEKSLKIHKMDDWKTYRVEMYGRLIIGGQNGGFDERAIAYRVQDNPSGIYETPKSYSAGVAYNDGSWLIYNTSRIIKKGDKALYKDKVFCRDTLDNKKKVGEICLSALNKELEEIDCCTRIDPREFALDPDMIERMTRGMTRKQATAETTRFQKRIMKQMKDDLIRKWYDPRLSVRDNITKVFRPNGIEDVSPSRLQQWIKEYIKTPGVRYGFQN